jgi:hypothetical protein
LATTLQNNDQKIGCKDKKMVTMTDDSKKLPASGTLHDINIAFHEGYEQQQRIIRKRVDSGEVLIIVKMANGLTAVCGEKRQEYLINGSHYHQLKAMAHLPPACYFALTQGKDQQVINAIETWFEQVEAEPSDEVNVELKNATQAFLKINKHTASVCHLSFMDFTKALEPIFAKLLSKSADDEVARLTPCLDEIYQHFNIDSANIFLIVFGAHQPRYKEMAKLVFKRWFSDLHEHIIDVEHHVRYSESGQSIEDAIDLVVTAITDREIAQNFLGTATGLDQDVLGIVANDAIERYWKKNQR